MSAGAPKQTFGDVAQTIIGLLLFIGGGAALFGTDFPKNDGNQPSKKIDDDLV